MLPKIECSDELLLGILNQDSGGSTELGLRHLDNCEHCQSRIEELAANEQQWTLAREGLCSRVEGGLDIGNDFQNPTRFHPTAEHSTDWTDTMAKQLLQPPSHPEMLGRLGRYEIERLVGSGGMGVVFKAYDSELHRSVAIKMLAPHLSGSRSARERFAREARAAAAIVNDHVVPIHNVETEHATPYLVMQYIAGDSLQARLDRDGPLDVREILRIGMQVAIGLAAAHAQGLIHRDVKPSNVMLDENVARALLTDFGLARTQDEACLTRSGFHPGTPHYMSPEQVRGEELDGRSDLFSLGCVLYALCTGHPPYRADSGYAVMRRITDEQPRSIREQNAQIPEWLERVVMRLLEKDREARFQSAEELSQILEQCLAHVQKPATEPLPLAVVPKASFFDRVRIRNWILAGMASAFLFFAGVLIVFETNKGTITIKSEADNVPIRIKRSDQVVYEMVVSRTGKSVRLGAGEYVIEFEGDWQDLVVEGENVSLVRGETKIIQITYRKSDGAEARMSADKSESKIDHSLDLTSSEGESIGSARTSGRTTEATAPHIYNAISPDVDFSKPNATMSTVASDLASVVNDFNRVHTELLRSSNSLPLTEDELVASLWWQYSQSKLREEIRETVKEIVITRKLPPGWSIKLNSREWELPQQWWHEKPLSSSAIQINLIGKEGLATTIRNQFVSSDTTSLQPPESSLKKAIEEFNKSHSEEPDLTLDETLAALSTIWGKQSWYSSDGLKPSTMDALLAAIDRQVMKGVKIELLRTYETGDDRFAVWSIQLVVQDEQDGSTQAFPIRERFQKVNSFSDETIHWGKPSDAGLQAGFRFKPVQTRYLAGQVVDVEFFYRTIHGKGLKASVPAAFHFNKIEIDLNRADGKQKLSVEHDREKIIGGWRVEGIGEQPTLFKNRKIRFVASPEELTIARQITDDWTTNVMLPINTKCDIAFDVPDFADDSKNAGSLLTGSVQFSFLNGSDEKSPLAIPSVSKSVPSISYESSLQSVLDSVKLKFDQGLATPDEVLTAEMSLVEAKIRTAEAENVASLPALLKEREGILQRAFLAAKAKHEAGLIEIDEFSQIVAELVDATFAKAIAANGNQSSVFKSLEILSRSENIPADRFRAEANKIAKQIENELGREGLWRAVELVVSVDVRERKTNGLVRVDRDPHQPLIKLDGELSELLDSTLPLQLRELGIELAQPSGPKWIQVGYSWNIQSHQSYWYYLEQLHESRQHLGIDEAFLQSAFFSNDFCSTTSAGLVAFLKETKGMPPILAFSRDLSISSVSESIKKNLGYDTVETLNDAFAKWIEEKYALQKLLTKTEDVRVRPDAHLNQGPFFDSEVTTGEASKVDSHSIETMKLRNEVEQLKKKIDRMNQTGEEHVTNVRRIPFPKEMQGVWRIKEAFSGVGEENGRIALEQYANQIVTISDSTMFLRSNIAGNHWYLSSLDAGTSPKQVELSVRPESVYKTFACLLEIQGDKLYLTRAQSPTSPRPKSVQMLGKGESLFVMSRLGENPITPDEVIQISKELHDANEDRTVRFKVESVHAPFVLGEPNDGHREGEIHLDCRPDPHDFSRDLFLVVLTAECQKKLSSEGVEDITKHFLGKTITAKGPVRGVEYTARDMRGVHFHLIVDDPSKLFIDRSE